MSKYSKLISSNGRGLLTIRNLLDGTTEEVRFDPFNSASVADAERRAKAREDEIMYRIEVSKLGRSLTNNEIWEGMVAAREDRDPIMQQHDREWMPVPRSRKTNLDKLADQLEVSDDSWKTRSRPQNMLDDIAAMQERLALGEKATESARKHRLRTAEQREKLTKLWNDSRWKEGEPASYRDAIRKAMAQLDCEDGCPDTTRNLLKQVEYLVGERKRERLESLNVQSRALADMQARLAREHFALVQDEEPLQEHQEQQQPEQRQQFTSDGVPIGNQTTMSQEEVRQAMIAEARDRAKPKAAETPNVPNRQRAGIVR
jgi:hypothetical protein